MTPPIQYRPGAAIRALFVVPALLAACSGPDQELPSLEDPQPPVEGPGTPTGPKGMSGPLGDIKLGAPISAPDGVWTTVPFPEAYCRDGSKAHLAVRLNSASKKFAIYLEGGGACFNDTSCTLLTFNFQSYKQGKGIFNFDHPDNPLRDFNLFYVPYCTGDVHAGDNLAGKPGLLTPPQHYSGYSNLKLYLSRILATVPDATDELLTGISAGGFGAALTLDLVARNMPATVQRFTLLDDSGPPMPKSALPTCLQEQWQKVWGFQNTFLKDCGPSCARTDDYALDYLRFILGKWANGPHGDRFRGGLISSTGDGIISKFFGFGANNCKATIALSPTQYEAGLSETRHLARTQTTRFGTYYYPSTAHTTLAWDAASNIPAVGTLGGLYDTKVAGVKLTDWIKDLLAHKAADHVGP